VTKSAFHRGYYARQEDVVVLHQPAHCVKHPAAIKEKYKLRRIELFSIQKAGVTWNQVTLQLQHIAIMTEPEPQMDLRREGWPKMLICRRGITAEKTAEGKVHVCQ
jgi:hypothetical protein